MTAWTDKVVVVVSISRAEVQRPSPIPAARHVGAFCAEDFAAQGAQLFVIDPDAEAIAALCGTIRARGGRVDGMVADLVSPEELEAARDACLQRHGGADVLVNAHIEIEPGGVEASSYESWRRVVEQDLLGPVFAAKAFLPLLKRAKAGAVVHIGSVDGTLGHPHYPSYSAAKGGVAALTHVMAHDFGRYGIRVNCVARALIAERGVAGLPTASKVETQTALKRWGYPEEIASAVRFLASAEAGYITGAVVPVDGGLTALTPGCGD